jgi:hypothetical protein
MTNKPTLYIVGDSTLSCFNDTSYYYPRYGYGTQLKCFIDETKINIVNLALSGRSSKSYLLENNYQTVKNNIKSGDFLLIGFGHNNEKDDDIARFTSANLPIDNENSFMYSLNEYYIKLAKDVGATPILCTPIVRLNVDGIYEGTTIHETPNGDYRQNILDLGKLVNVLAIDLTTPTKELFLNIGVEESSLHHAITAGKYADDKLVPNYKSVDKAHLNIYGAKYVAYLVYKGILTSSNPLNDYLFENCQMPLKEAVLEVNPEYKLVPYKAPNEEDIILVDHLNTKGSGWNATAFGATSCNPLDALCGFVAKPGPNGFIVGQIGEKLFGRFNASFDGFACCYKQVSASDNFTIKVKAKVVDLIPSKQTSFGLMLRDDMYINQTEPHASTMNNYVSAGFLTLNVSTNILFSRECTTELTMEKNIFDGFYNLDDEATLEIVRLGQSITTKVIYKEKEYKKNYMDFDLTAVDRDYMYICLYSTCGTVVEFSDIEFNITGKAIEA